MPEEIFSKITFLSEWPLFFWGGEVRCIPSICILEFLEYFSRFSQLGQTEKLNKVTWKIENLLEQTRWIITADLLENSQIVYSEYLSIQFLTGFFSNNHYWLVLWIFSNVVEFFHNLALLIASEASFSVIWETQKTQ